MSTGRWCVWSRGGDGGGGGELLLEPTQLPAEFTASLMSSISCLWIAWIPLGMDSRVDTQFRILHSSCA